jgi:hypothetical protein
MIYKSFSCGLTLFLLNIIFLLSRLTPIFLFTANLLPGFLYGYLLVSEIKNTGGWRPVLFILFSGCIYILAARVATGYSLFGDNVYISFPFASIAGAILLLLDVKLFLKEDIRIAKGIGYCLLTGVVSSFLPLLGYFVKERLDSQFPDSYIFTISALSVFLVWQPLFAWSIAKAGRIRNEGNV